MSYITILADQIVYQNVLVCMSNMVAKLASGYGNVSHNGDLNGLAEQAFELCTPGLDYEEAARQDPAWLDEAESGPAQIFCEQNGLDPYEREVFQHWAVSTWLAEKLQEAGERVDTDFAGLNVWARTTTGQAIRMDSVILKIAAALYA